MRILEFTLTINLMWVVIVITIISTLTIRNIYTNKLILFRNNNYIKTKLLIKNLRISIQYQLILKASSHRQLLHPHN